VRLAFLVTVPPKTGPGERSSPIVASAQEGDNAFYTASTTLAPGIPAGQDGGSEALHTETMECEIPVRVLPGNTAFKVRPAVYVM
jgi:hypothetical protein